MSYQYHPYHMVEPSLYPFFASLGGLATIITWMQGLTEGMESFSLFDFIHGGFCTVYTVLIAYYWITEVCYEATWHGCHTWYVQVLFRIGWVFFVLTEIMLFFSFFWTFFYYSLSPSVEMGMQWVPSSILLINPFHVPLLNTVVLLSSGVTATLSHYYFLTNFYKKAGSFMTLTLLLGVYFLCLQLWEYNQTFFTMSDSVFGSIFFITTGMHGGHVCAGTINLFIARWRMTHMGWSEWVNWDLVSDDINKLFGKKISSDVLLNHFKLPSQFTYYSHLNLELGIWYWHFVDVVWLFLYCFYYCWIYLK